MDPGFGPDEWLGVLVVGFDEGIDVLAELGDGSERGAVQRAPKANHDYPECEDRCQASPKHALLHTKIGF
jgi:hypothetical protein